MEAPLAWVTFRQSCIEKRREKRTNEGRIVPLAPPLPLLPFLSSFHECASSVVVVSCFIRSKKETEGDEYRQSNFGTNETKSPFQEVRSWTHNKGWDGIEGYLPRIFSTQ